MQPAAVCWVAIKLVKDGSEFHSHVHCTFEAQIEDELCKNRTLQHQPQFPGHDARLTLSRVLRPGELAGPDLAGVWRGSDPFLLVSQTDVERRGTHRMIAAPFAANARAWSPWTRSIPEALGWFRIGDKLYPSSGWRSYHLTAKCTAIGITNFKFMCRKRRPPRSESSSGARRSQGVSWSSVGFLFPGLTAHLSKPIMRVLKMCIRGGLWLNLVCLACLGCDREIFTRVRFAFFFYPARDLRIFRKSTGTN